MAAGAEGDATGEAAAGGDAAGLAAAVVGAGALVGAGAFVEPVDAAGADEQATVTIIKASGEIYRATARAERKDSVVTAPPWSRVHRPHNTPTPSRVVAYYVCHR